jgi:hypothetical protein
MSKNISVYALYGNRSSLEYAVGVLAERGFRQEDVSVLLPENLGNKDLVTEKNSKSPEGAMTGGATGGVVGGALGWLVGIGALAIPGLGPFIAAGPIIAALAGVGAGAALGGVAGGLIGLGMPEFEAKRYEGRVKSGGSLISVHCDNDEWADKAEAILRETGGEDVTRAGQASADFDKTDKPHARGVPSI